MISVCVQEHKRTEGHVRQICERMRSDRNRPSLQFNQSELGELSLASADGTGADGTGAVRLAYETLEHVATDAGVEQYISELEGDGMHLGFSILSSNLRLGARLISVKFQPGKTDAKDTSAHLSAASGTDAKLRACL